MALKEIQLKFASKCTGCGRELKQGWKAYFDGQTTPKTVLCTNCYKSSGQTAIDSNQLEQLRQMLRSVGIDVPEPEPEAPSIEESILDQAINLHTRFDTFAEQMASVLNAIDVIKVNLGVLVAKDKPPKKEG